MRQLTCGSILLTLEKRRPELGVVVAGIGSTNVS
jgi:hypothetical protein